MELLFKVENQHLNRVDNIKTIVAFSKNYLTAKFDFSDDWEDIDKKAIFRKDCKNYIVDISEEKTCEVPEEVLSVGTVYMSVFGGDLITTDVIEIYIDKTLFDPSMIEEDGEP